MLSGKEKPRGGPAETAFKRAPAPMPRLGGADGADGKGVRTPRFLSRRDLLRAGVTMPLIGAAWSVASCSAPVSRGDAEPTTSAPVSPTPSGPPIPLARRTFPKSASWPPKSQFRGAAAWPPPGPSSSRKRRKIFQRWCATAQRGAVQSGSRWALLSPDGRRCGYVKFDVPGFPRLPGRLQLSSRATRNSTRVDHSNSTKLSEDADKKKGT